MHNYNKNVMTFGRNYHKHNDYILSILMRTHLLSIHRYYVLTGPLVHRSTGPPVHWSHRPAGPLFIVHRSSGGLRGPVNGHRCMPIINSLASLYYTSDSFSLLESINYCETILKSLSIPFKNFYYTKVLTSETWRIVFWGNE
jgi:hypothetical protein